MRNTIDYRDELIVWLREKPDHVTEYLNASLHEGGDVFLLALKDVVDANGGISAVSREVQPHRGSLHRMLAKSGNPTFHNLEEIMNACGLRFTVEKREAKAAG